MVDNPSKCLICFAEPMVIKGVVNGCRHEFCPPCIRNWATETPFCPLCRQYVWRVDYEEDGELKHFCLPSRAQRARLQLYSNPNEVVIFPSELQLYRIRRNYIRSVRMFVERDMTVIQSLLDERLQVDRDTIWKAVDDVVRFVKKEISFGSFCQKMRSCLRHYAPKFVYELGAYLSTIRDDAEE